MGLYIALVRGQDLHTKDNVGKGNPYFKFLYGDHDWKTDNKSGSQPSWDRENHEFHAVREHNELYVLHLDNDFGADNVIAGCCIDLSKLESVTNGWFMLYDKDGKNFGRVLLNISKDDKPSNLPSERNCESFLNEELKKMIKHENRSAMVKDYGMGALAMGAMGYLAANQMGK